MYINLNNCFIDHLVGFQSTTSNLACTWPDKQLSDSADGRTNPAGGRVQEYTSEFDTNSTTIMIIASLNDHSRMKSWPPQMVEQRTAQLLQPYGFIVYKILLYKHWGRVLARTFRLGPWKWWWTRGGCGHRPSFQGHVEFCFNSEPSESGSEAFWDSVEVLGAIVLQTDSKFAHCMS